MPGRTTQDSDEEPSIPKKGKGAEKRAVEDKPSDLLASEAAIKKQKSGTCDTCFGLAVCHPFTLSPMCECIRV